MKTLRRSFNAKMITAWILTALIAISLVGAVSANDGMEEKAKTGPRYRVTVQSGYLALRNDKVYDSSNEIGQLYDGDIVVACDTYDPDYWYVYSPKLNRYGFANNRYLVRIDDVKPVPYDPVGKNYTVSVQTGYLALRNAPAFQYENEIGKLYTGDVVTVQSIYDNTYWYVYSSKYGCCGYVNKNYLVR